MRVWPRLALGFAAGLLSALLPAGAGARVITNVASIEWMSGNDHFSTLSNQVDVSVQALPPLDTGIYRITSDGQGRASRIDGTGCTANAQTTAGLFANSPASAASAPIAVTLTREGRFDAGEPVAFGINAPSDNRDPTARDVIDVIVRTDTGDLETLRLREDSENSGFFVGYLPTQRTPPAVQQYDCRLSVDPGRDVIFTLFRQGSQIELASASVSFLVDPFGIVFDSGDGAPVAGSRVTLINAATGQPAQVFGDDGVSVFPSTVVTGTTVTDSGGTTYAFPAGDYRFPFVAPGTYRLVVEPPNPYAWPSTATPSELAVFNRPDNGAPYAITGASFGAIFQLVTPSPVRIDVPVDRPSAALSIIKSTSTTVAVPGEAIQYRITIINGDARRATGRITVSDRLPRALRLRLGTIRYNGVTVTPAAAPDGSSFDVDLPPLAAGSSAVLTYIAEVRPDAEPGDAVNTASAQDNRGSISNVSDAVVRVRRDVLGDRIVIIGRITGGGCAIDPTHSAGIGGVRVMLEDGSFTVTDSDGRYHFEGLRPGLHVVQIDPSSLPDGAQAIDCAANTRSAGSAISRFVEGRGGELKRADFFASGEPRPSADRANSANDAETGNIAAPAVGEKPDNDAMLARVTEGASPRPDVASDAAAAGGEIDWFAGQAAGIDWLFPSIDYNPRSPSIRVAIKHLAGQHVELRINGRPVDTLNFDGASTSPDRTFQVSVWRGIEIEHRDNMLQARVINPDGTLAQELTRTVHYADSPIRATFLQERSHLVADGLTRPVIAVLLTDRDGRPVKHGLVGDFTVDPPHRAALEIDAEQARQVAGLEGGRATWRIAGDDGIAYIELEPTTASGGARINFTFREEESSRNQQLDVWLNPGNRPWTVVGFAAGTVGYNTLDDRMEPVAETLPGDSVDGRIALYAKGRVLGQWLMTLSYDSDKEKDETRFGGVIDPRAYYTIYADRADRGFDAASVRNLYLRLERPQFYALFGDFETGLNEPELARYQRSLNGAKAEYRGDHVSASAFVADTPYRYRRDELQGSGLTGPYQLGARDILANSERITIEVRDRLRSNFVLDRRTLTRHIDYDIDYFAGTLRFRQPVLSRDDQLNPQFIIADYEVDGVGQRVTNAGGRVSWTTSEDHLRIGATAIHDETDTSRTNLGGVDLRYRPNAETELRGEFAISDSTSSSAAIADAGQSYAWLVEAEHHGSNFDVLAYARERQSGFGVGQLSNAGDASRKFGVDGTLRIGRGFSLLASGWQENYLDRDAQRRAGRLLAEWRNQTSSLRAGITYAEDQLSTGGSNRSTIVQLGGTQRLLNQRLELDAQTEFALSGQNDSVDFPARHRLGARFAINPSVSLVGSYEIASGGSVDSRTARLGLDVRPWDGGRAVVSANQQDIGEFGPRSYAAYGLAQSFRLSDHVTVDATLDGQRTLRGIRTADVLDPAHPVASGGYLDGSGALTEDFIALTAGASYHADTWNITGRAEYRDGEIANRFGVTFGGIRRIGDGRAFGGLITWTRADSRVTASTESVAAEISWANRPASSRLSFLEKLELHYDSVSGATAGQAGPIGGPALQITGDARSMRVINSLAINYTPTASERTPIGRRWSERGEYAVFLGVRYADQRFGEDDIKGWSAVVGADMRFDLAKTVSVGVAGTVRTGTDARTIAWGGGPQIVVTPFTNANLVIGYNFSGFRDRDFEESRYSRGGVYATFRLKFDQTSLAGLHL